MLYLDDLKCLAACWPQPAVLAERMSVDPERLAGYVAGKKTMPPGVRDRLASAMGMHLRESPFLPGVFFFETNLGYVLRATESRKRTQAAYDLLSHGGSVSFSLEVIPNHGHASRRYRYLVFQPDWETRLSVMAFDRAGAVYSTLDDEDALLNSSARCPVPAHTYAAVDAVAQAVLAGKKHPTCATEELGRRQIDFMAADKKAAKEDEHGLW